MAEAVAVAAQLPVFPRKLADQAQAVRLLLRAAARPMTPQQVAQSFKVAGPARVEEVQETLVQLGQAREASVAGTYSA